MVQPALIQSGLNLPSVDIYVTTKFELLTHLRPCPCPPLGGAYCVVTGSPGLWAILSAVFAVDRPVGAVVERLHALHHPGVVAELPAGFTAGTPLFHHPPVSTAGFLFLYNRNYNFFLR